MATIPTVLRRSGTGDSGHRFLQGPEDRNVCELASEAISLRPLTSWSLRSASDRPTGSSAEEPAPDADPAPQVEKRTDASASAFFSSGSVRSALKSLYERFRAEFAALVVRGHRQPSSRPSALRVGRSGLAELSARLSPAGALQGPVPSESTQDADHDAAHFHLLYPDRLQLAVGRLESEPAVLAVQALQRGFLARQHRDHHFTVERVAATLD